MKQDNAFTGLEAAIVLIAFVVVAAIFSYVLLGAGFFATQKAQEVTYAGIQQTISNVVVDGSMYANVTDSKLDGFTFNVRVPLGGEAVDMSQTTFLFTSNNNQIPTTMRINATVNGNVGNVAYAYPAANACGGSDPIPCANVYYPEIKENCGKGAYGCTSTLLTSGEFATYMVSINKAGMPLGAKDWFALEMRPRVGAATLITKTIASGLQGGEVL